MTDNFLPDGYKVPKTGGNYMKFVDGANKFRILAAPIIGYEYWTRDNKPVRSREPFGDVPGDARLDEGVFKPKHFWALPVWNYQDKAVQILELTQSTIQSAITDLIANVEWGDPREYDLTVNKKGVKLDTEYTVQPSPQKELNPLVKRQFEKMSINLEALYDGENPFGADDRSQKGPMGEDSFDE